jgi:hypothetical protein
LSPSAAIHRGALQLALPTLATAAAYHCWTAASRRVPGNAGLAYSGKLVSQWVGQLVRNAACCFGRALAAVAMESPYASQNTPCAAASALSLWQRRTVPSLATAPGHSVWFSPRTPRSCHVSYLERRAPPQRPPRVSPKAGVPRGVWRPRCTMRMQTVRKHTLWLLAHVRQVDPSYTQLGSWER